MKPQKTIDKLSGHQAVTIVALGDSLTQGWMEPRSFVQFLEDMIREKYGDPAVEIINKGVPGDTASGGLFRLDQDVLPWRPDLVLVQFGINDACNGISPDDFKATIEQIIDRISLETRAEIILLTSVPIDSIMDMGKYYDGLKSTAQQKNIPLVPIHEYWNQYLARENDKQELFHEDGVHPTLAGYRLMAEAVFQFFS